MKQIPVSVLTLVAGLIVAISSIWVGQHHGLLPEQASVQATLVDPLFNAMVTIGFGLFVLVEGAIVIFAIQFRQRPGDETDGVPVEGNVPLEIFWTLIPAVIILGLSVYTVDVYSQMGGLGHRDKLMLAQSDSQVQWVADQFEDEAVDGDSTLGPYGLTGGDTPADLVVNVTGMQYAWLFDYPESGVYAGELHIPVNQEIQLQISAADVIHSFWVPEFRLKQDAIPGQPTELRFQAIKTGEYPIVCAELCGAYHGGMRSTVVVEEQDEFEAWLDENLFAQAQSDRVVAFNPETPVEAHAHDLGITPAVVSTLQHTHHDHS